MSTFWSGYIALLTLGTIVALFWLIFATRQGESAGSTDKTMGHSFDGIEEYDNPLPKWWFWLFIGTLVFGILYLVIYPGLGNWKGVFPGYDDGWTQEKQWQREVDQADVRFGPIFATYSAMTVAEAAQDANALKIGGRLFTNYCSTCHGSDAKGSSGFPNLADRDWRWGGDAETIKTTILHGRVATMPAWGPVIGEDGVRNVAAFVRHELAGLSLPEGTGADLAAGHKVYAETCSVCHGQGGEGMSALGVPRLNDAAGWIYGSSLAQLQQTIRHGRNGQMPAQAQYLGNDKVHLLAAYVYNLSQQPEQLAKQ